MVGVSESIVGKEKGSYWGGFIFSVQVVQKSKYMYQSPSNGKKIRMFIQVISYTIVET